MEYIFPVPYYWFSKAYISSQSNFFYHVEILILHSISNFSILIGVIFGETVCRFTDSFHMKMCISPIQNGGYSN